MLVLEQLKEAEQSKQAEANEQFTKLVLRLGDNEDVSLAEVQRILSAAGKSSADLENSISGYRYWREQTDRLREINQAFEVELPEATRQVEAANAELLAAQRARDAKVFPLAQRIDAIQQMGIERITIEREIVEHARPEFHLRAKQLRDAQNRLENELFAPQRNLTAAHSTVRLKFSKIVLSGQGGVS
jgi:hypothetical protein